MATRVLLRDRPSRAIALATTTNILVFRFTDAPGGSGPNASRESLGSAHGGYASSSGNNPANGPGGAGAPRCMVELLSTDKADLNGYRIISKHSVHGTLGLITVDDDVFLCVVSSATKVASVRPGESIQRIASVDFHCVNTSEYDHILHENINVHPMSDVDEDGWERDGSGAKRDPILEHPCLALRKLLSGGSFYYSADFDLTSRLQARSADPDSFDFDSFDKGYLWNSYMIKPLIDFRSRLSDNERKALDSTRLITSAIRGFAHTLAVPPHSSPARIAPAGLPSTLTLISRLSCRRAGTRFNARGIDDDGAVANYVESETVYWSPGGLCFSYVQIRGSIPLFWEQSAGFLPGQQKIQITRSAQATQPAFDKHFEDLVLKYGPVHVVNLLSKDKTGEVELSQRYSNHISHCSLNNTKHDPEVTSEHTFIRETDYDFHAETRTLGYEAANGIWSRPHMRDSADSFGYCLTENVADQTSVGSSANSSNVHVESLDATATEKLAQRPLMILQQEGVFRTNCLDCLDRTNLMQTIISQGAIESFLLPRGERPASDFLARHGSLWADNGDALSRIYAGTGALKSSFTRHGKMSLAGALADARKSATRMYINNFADKDRQTTMDILLGRLIGQMPVYLYDPINDYVVNELSKRTVEYSSTRDIRIWAGTYNLNGRSTGLNADLSAWLCPPVDAAQQNPDIVAVGFQEIVELNPQHIMSTEPTRRQAWEKAVRRTLNDNAKKCGSVEYVLLRGGQLVGASLSIFVKTDILPHIKNVEGSTKKTGMSGMAGNKGAVAIRMDIDNTRVCFVTAHLAAGFANYEERNRDYKTINHGLRFQRNRLIDDHDRIIWMGDFNYRIGLGDEQARRLVRMGDIGRLYENDQLNLQMVAGLTFPHYSEARIRFNPTYKYDVGTDDYDTSEKSRIPAWTDRILHRGKDLRQIDYDIAPFRFSDHRPVYATFVCKISTINENVKNKLSKEIYSQRRAAVARSANNSDDSEDDLIGFEAIESGLPPASSERKRWWLENGMPARSTVMPPSEQHIANPARPSNPFALTNQPDWVLKSQSQSQKPASPATKPSTSSTLPPPLQPTRSQNSLGDSNPSKPTSALSSSPSISRKPAPPIPRKPGSLSGASVGSSASIHTSPVMDSLHTLDHTKSLPTNGSASSASPLQTTSVPTLPTRPRPTTAAEEEGPRPGLPPRKPLRSATSGSSTSASTGLMDDQDEEAGGSKLAGWEPLKPGR